MVLQMRLLRAVASLSRMSILAIDAGTTGVTAVVVNVDGAIVTRGYSEFPQRFPKPGWVEHTPEDIWQATLAATQAVLASYDASQLRGIGITNQRETIVMWDRETLASPRNAIVWQDRRTAEICDDLRSQGHESRVRELTGLRLDPYFSGTKLRWLAMHEPDTWDLVESGRYAVGTVDSYLIARMTRGLCHVTDVSNASRTLLFDLASGDWSSELCALFGVPQDALPRIVPNWGEVATTEPAAFCNLSLPIAGIAGDQQSALFGQTCFDPGDSKCTYGTGSFILTNTGSELTRSDAGLLTTAAWRAPDGTTSYALEGAIFVTGAAVQWLRDGLQIIGSASETAALAETVPDSGGVVFVPALTGLGAPHWDPRARGLIIGITRGTTRAHIVRATLEAIACEVRDVLETMGDLGTLKVDGGASANDLLCQIQADQVGLPVERPKIVETTALGAAFLAGLGVGVWDSTEQLRATWQRDRRFEPDPDRGPADAIHRRWAVGVTRSKGWAED
jgi:glycerol kinase